MQGQFEACRRLRPDLIVFLWRVERPVAMVATSPDLLRRLMTTLQGVTGSIDEHERTVDLLYATNRVASSNDVYFSGERNNSALTYGSATVRIPEAHHLGDVERPFKIGFLSLTVYEQPMNASPRG